VIGILLMGDYCIEEGALKSMRILKNLFYLGVVF
tara:strand:- start:431 stop:532 length:102 start_codon:yes stop_codon:yes gene_type:complete